MKLKFLMAEEFRPEANNKMSALGIFPDDTVILQKLHNHDGIDEKKPLALERLAFLIAISDLAGAHNFKGTFIGPDGKSLTPDIQPQSLGDSVVIEPGTSRSIVVEAKPFMIKILGIYKFVFYIDDQPNEFPFEIRK